MDAAQTQLKPVQQNRLTLEDGTDRLSRNVGTKLPFYPMSNPKKCADLIYMAAEAWNLAPSMFPVTSAKLFFT